MERFWQNEESILCRTTFALLGVYLFCLDPVIKLVLCVEQMHYWEEIQKIPPFGFDTLGLPPKVNLLLRFLLLV